MSNMNTVCVFCGSNTGTRQEYADAAQRMGQLLAARGVTLVYGGGRVGLMGILARATLEAGGKVIGVIPEALKRKELVYSDLTELHVVSSMHERKAMMADASDGFVALPGGYGTFEEFCEVLTWSQLGIHQKPVGLLNVAGYYDGLLSLFDHAVQEQFVREQHRSMVIAEHDAARLLDRMATYEPPQIEKWMNRDAV